MNTRDCSRPTALTVLTCQLPQLSYLVSTSTIRQRDWQRTGSGARTWTYTEAMYAHLLEITNTAVALEPGGLSPVAERRTPNTLNERRRNLPAQELPVQQ